jgi:hypothetical protein
MVEKKNEFVFQKGIELWRSLRPINKTQLPEGHIPYSWQTTGCASICQWRFFRVELWRNLSPTKKELNSRQAPDLVAHFAGRAKVVSCRCRRAEL